ncbi:unnamed protein product [Moneuplotes crassus]|uniref:Uncharacterized protein n=1 Tax=Euplotes crassus TaxID=5936 RepID=A0AAD1Y5T0_EUPCR|nr:unnamed protein product [Moneuplotes crassus]
MRSNDVIAGSLGNLRNSSHGSLYNVNPPNSAHQWGDFSLAHAENTKHSQVIFPSDEITNETIRRENKLREKKMNDLQQFNDLYEYLNTRNKTKSINMAKPSKKTRNKLEVALHTEKYQAMDSNLNPIREMEEPDSGCAIPEKRKLNYKKLSFNKKKEVANNTLKKSDVHRSVDPDYRMIRGERKRAITHLRKRSDNNLEKANSHKDPNSNNKVLKPPQNVQKNVQKITQNRQERSNSDLSQTMNQKVDPRSSTPNLKDSPQSLLGRRNAIRFNFSNARPMATTLKKDSITPILVHSSVLQKDKEKEQELSDLDQSFYSKDGKDATIDKKPTKKMKETPALSITPDLSVTQSLKKLMAQDTTKNSKIFRRKPNILAQKGKISSPKKFQRLGTEHIESLDQNRKRLILLDMKKRKNNKRPQVLRRLKVIHKEIGHSHPTTFIRNSTRLFSSQDVQQVDEEIKLKKDFEHKESVGAHSSAVQNSLETEEISGDKSSSSLDTIIEPNSIPYSFMSKPVVQSSKLKRSMQILPKRISKLGFSTSDPQRIKAEPKVLSRRVSKFLNIPT